jgi:hypothetical protein
MLGVLAEDFLLDCLEVETGGWSEFRDFRLLGLRRSRESLVYDFGLRRSRESFVDELLPLFDRGASVSHYTR